MGFKKIIVTSFENGMAGKFRIRSTLTTRAGIDAKDFDDAKRKVQKIIQVHVVGDKHFTVEWSRDGMPEGYMVSL